MDACVGRVSGQDSFQSDRELMIRSLKLCHVELGLNAVMLMWKETEKGFCHHLKSLGTLFLSLNTVQHLPFQRDERACSGLWKKK